MALDLDRVRALQFPLPQRHGVPASSDKAVPRTIVHRAASFESAKEDDVQDGPSSPGVKRTFSDASLSARNEPAVKENFSTGKDILRRVTLRPSSKPSKSSTRLATSRQTSREASKQADPPSGTDGSTLKERSGNLGTETENPRQNATPAELAVRPTKPRSVSGKIATLARVSWMSNSRSPSPARSETRPTPRSREHSPTPRSQPLQAESKESLESKEKRENKDSKDSKVSKESKELPADLSDADSKRHASKRYRRPLSAFVTRSKSADPPAPSLRIRKSMDQLTREDVVKPDLPPLPTPPAFSTITAAEPARKKDELWIVFRGLEADLQKFQTKSTNLKVNVVKASLLPFLARYASHSSFNGLRPEDLDRRVNILNKWWTALLTLLHGRHNQSVSGTDRPVYLEALSGIMMRKEWTIPYHPQTPPANSSNCSLESSSSDFLAESIYHNVRNIFNQNLLSQMSFVVERMSLRHAPASLVSFCGTACAYAFFFCPGVADMLVRLWNTPSDVFRRLLADPSVYRGTGSRTIPQNLAARFPLPVRSLAFSSHIALSRYLRQPTTLPLSAVQIPWQGPWMSRWCGRDSDLFFVFVKYFHMISCEFLPKETENACRIFSPGMLSVQGHLLTVLEDTLYRQSSSQVPENAFGPSTVTFDDFIEGPNASMSSPIGMANCHRSMAENRQIILLRDFLAEPSAPELSQARRMYVEGFMLVLKTAARKTSLFNHNACFVLCDFVEEAAPLVSRYGRKVKADIFDWPFWMDVCKKLTRSENSMTEVRLFAFLFAMWKTWTSNVDRYNDLCTQFLLHDDYFYAYFSHWNPMVRAYFHRLLCWRMARFNANPTPADGEIYEMLLDKIEQVWNYYMSFNIKAQEENRPLLSAELCSPAPNRRILIIRSDNQAPSPSNPFISFDRFTNPGSTYNQNIGTLKLDPNGLPDGSAPKRRWNLLKSVFGSTANPKPGEVTPPGSVSDENEVNPMDLITGEGNVDKNEDTGSGSSSPQDTTDQSAEDTDSIYEANTPHDQQYNFKFSLENHPWKPAAKTRPITSPNLPKRTLDYVQHQRSSRALTMRTPRPEYEAEADSNKTKQSFESTKTSPNDDDLDTSTASTANSYATTTHTSSSVTSFDDHHLHHHKPVNTRVVASKYAGRALAEWAQVVSEFDNFFERRRSEGVPSDELVETPMLSVENFRK